MSMNIRFWGTRGSIPVSLTAQQVRDKLRLALRLAGTQRLESELDIENFLDRLDFSQSGTYGGQSSCVQIDAGQAEPVVLDLGSGARPLGQALLKQHGLTQPQTCHVFMSHLHWDHIMGFPFFGPAYIAGNRIVIHACHEQLEAAFRRQQDHPSFPVALEQMAADIEFDVLQPGHHYSIAGLDVYAIRQRHPGDSYGWRFQHQGRSVVYSTDSEHRIESAPERGTFVDFFAGADLVIFDAMYSLADAITVKQDWGHSSNLYGVDLCLAARVRQLVLFHHEPAHDDALIDRILTETRRYEEISRSNHRLEVISAWDGLELTV